jgi:hypothetical protein
MDALGPSPLYLTFQLALYLVSSKSMTSIYILIRGLRYFRASEIIDCGEEPLSL